MRAAIFPGQGSQTVGMGRALAEQHAEARAVFEEVDDALGEKLSTVMWEGPADDLTLTANAQPALMATSLATIRAVERALDKRLPEFAARVAGHSLGEYSALAAARALSITDAARLLRARGEAMQAAVPVGEGAMAAILGLDLETAEAVAEEAAAGGRDEVCEAANDNAPGQVVLSGHKTAIDRAIDIAKARGAKRALPLPVSAPFHCALMRPAADVMAEALASTEIAAPSVPLVANVTAAVTSEPDEIRKLLVAQVSGRVRWRESVLAMAADGTNELVEFGAGKVLTGLAKRIHGDLTARAVGAPADVEAFCEAIS